MIKAPKKYDFSKEESVPTENAGTHKMGNIIRLGGDTSKWLLLLYFHSSLDFRFSVWCNKARATAAQWRCAQLECNEVWKNEQIPTEKKNSLIHSRISFRPTTEL